ncbi:hypothetical protein SKAU_G00281730 [Synaphobranchus kaupii]|uniref:Uncharacterized protein n=1 Tax=Synaphobranchus kaupii TaxID=118154 RepID=A0A9Q1EX80_SYNKA|nr:hypothetical protein SKAU_G00281730 [Synaphobranchus kaupii]
MTERESSDLRLLLYTCFSIRRPPTASKSPGPQYHHQQELWKALQQARKKEIKKGLRCSRQCRMMALRSALLGGRHHAYSLQFISRPRPGTIGSLGTLPQHTAYPGKLEAPRSRITFQKTTAEELQFSRLFARGLHPAQPLHPPPPTPTTPNLGPGPGCPNPILQGLHISG